ncbi:non-ribosomal peptide synthetase [Butyrivibrio sp. VCD2006]|uniref:non-ribosomal peptide synthetase n=1 Tax=Butyrivibrio sp. VCD2006 TaxID=1280664 RepID=UPI00041195D1|nr:non-ribosomal peptide synthetase [Butyrivibrio sp. VCD2006]
MKKNSLFMSIPEKIALLAKERPDDSAVIASDRILTYRNLDEMGNRAAYAIMSLCPGLEEGDVIGLLLDRKSYVFSLEIGIVRAGYAYMPMTDEYPEDRINFCMENADSKVLITTKEIFDRKQDLDTNKYKVLLVEEVLSYEGEPVPLPEIKMDRLSHIFYTSGSTGVPKGVRNTILADTLSVTVTKDDPTLFEQFKEPKVSMCITQINFIASICDYQALYNGDSLVFAEEKDYRDMSSLIEKMLRFSVQSLLATPSFVKNLMTIKQSRPAIAILDFMILVGEKLDASVLEPVFTCNPWLRVINAYGMTETNSYAFSKILTSENREISIGDPMHYLAIKIIDEYGDIVPDGTVGELILSGDTITTGYQKLEERNKESFIMLNGERFYRTGDMAYIGEKGQVCISGRADDMVKYHGQRVELGEIEKVIMQHPEVNLCKVLMRNNGFEDFLVAFFTCSKEVKHKDITELVKTKLPAYMFPGAMVQLDEMPLNANNKIDRAKLLEIEIPSNGGDYEEPETELEEKLCGYFSDVLGLKRMSVIGDFFDYGGTSLSVSRLLATLGDGGFSVSYGDVFANPTPRSLAHFIENADARASLPAMDRKEYPLTKTQLGIYLEGLTGGSKETYTVQYMMEADPEINENQLIDAVNTLFEAHPTLKYMIRCRENELPYMELVPDYKVEVPVFEGESSKRIDFINSYMPVVKVLDNLLFNFAVYKTEKCCYLILKAQLIAVDGTSLSLIISDLNRALDGKELLKEDCCIQQVGMYEEELIKNGSYDKAKEYYQNLFSKMDSIDQLMGDLNNPLTPGVSVNYRYEPGTLKAQVVRDFCNKNQVSESSFFMGAMALLLGKYLYADHVSFSTVYNGRSLKEMDNTIGTLIKRIPVYGDLSENLPVTQYLSSMSKQIFANMSNDIFSFDEVLKNCPVNEDVELIFQGDLFTDNMGMAAGKQRLKSDSYFMEQYHTGMVTGCMSIQLFATNGLYNMTIEYRNERFSEGWIKRFADHLFIIANQLLTCEMIGDIVMMNDEDRAKIAEFNDKKVDFEFVPVHEQIRGFAKKSPQKKAVICDGKSLTFEELDLLSSQVAEKLIELNVGEDVPVGVLFDRMVYTYVVENGILKAGGGFVPFIPEYPDGRIDFCMQDAEISLLLTTEDIKKVREGLLGKQYKILTLEEIFGVSDISEISPDSKYRDFEIRKSKKDDLAYCIYTSGSTGRPKGVMIEHGNIANYVYKNHKSIEIMYYAFEGRVCLALASFSFDVSVVEEFVPLCNGNTVVIATEDEIHDPDKLAKVIIDNAVDGMTCTPTYLSSLLSIQSSREAIKNITFFDIGAEAFPLSLYDKLRELREDSVILNVYGPTECTMGCSADVVERGESITIGEPIANTYFSIFDKFGNELPEGIRGELIIGGNQVGRGYVGLPEKTEAAFFRHNDYKAYHSGDLCSWTNNGKVRIFGRIDNQVKLRGFRIELDEIERVMSEYQGIKAAAVKIVKTSSQEFLAGYYVCDKVPDLNAYKDYLKEKLPEYMVPQVMKQLEEMPLTINGKIDRKSLPDPDASELKAEYVAPENEIERKLCDAFAKSLGLVDVEIGTADDFFELGGDSLKAMMVLADAGIEGLTAADVFQKRTPKEIARVVDERTSLGDIDEREAKARLKPHILTPMQIKMLDYQLYNPGSSMWSNMHYFGRFGKEVDAQRLCDAVNKAIENHPGLSVVFEYNDDCKLQQRYAPELMPKIEVEDIKEEDVEELKKSLVKPFKKILKSCLLRVRVFRSEAASYLFFDVHHLLMDGGSLGVLFQDITDAYFGRELKKDYYFIILEDAEKAHEDGTYDADREYFTEQFDISGKEYQVLPKPDYESNKNSPAGRIKRLKFDADEVRAAEEYWGVTHSCMAIASALIALSEHDKINRVMTNWIFNDRLSPMSANVVGLLIKNLPVGVDMEDFDNIEDLLLDVKRQIGEGIAHSSYDYFSSMDSAFYTDPMEVNLQLEINADELDELKPEFIELDDPYFAASARLELELLENEYGDGGFDAELEYVKEIYDEDNILKFHDTYVKMLETLVKVGCEKVKNPEK